MNCRILPTPTEGLGCLKRGFACVDQTAWRCSPPSLLSSQGCSWCSAGAARTRTGVGTGRGMASASTNPRGHDLAIFDIVSMSDEPQPSRWTNLGAAVIILVALAVAYLSSR